MNGSSHRSCPAPVPGLGLRETSAPALPLRARGPQTLPDCPGETVTRSIFSGLSRRRFSADEICQAPGPAGESRTRPRTRGHQRGRCLQECREHSHPHFMQMMAPCKKQILPPPFLFPLPLLLLIWGPDENSLWQKRKYSFITTCSEIQSWTVVGFSSRASRVQGMAPESVYL